MSVHLLSVAVLVLVLVLGTVRPVNIGALALVASFIVGSLVFDESVDEILAAFPAKIFVLLVGVTYMFSIATRNGTVNWIVNHAFRALKHRGSLVPWVLYTLAACISTMGAFSPAVAAILAPVAFSAGKKYGIHSLRMSLIVGLGCIAGSFSPIGPLGAIVNGVVENAGLQSTPGLLYVWVMGLTTAVAIATSACVSRLEKRHVSKTLVPAGGPAFDSPTGSSFDSSRDQTDNPGDDAFQNPDVPQSRHGHAERLFTLAGIATMLVGALVFGGDIGFIALTIGVTLSIIFTESGKHAVKDVSWGVILLICGVITYIGLLERGGTVDWFGEVIARTGAPLIAAFLILLIGAVVSAAASTTGILGMLVPLSVPLIATGNVTAAGLTIALAISCSLVDLSPFSTGGAILMASAPESERAWNYRGLLTFTGIMIFVGPAVTWLLLVVPGW